MKYWYQRPMEELSNFVRTVVVIEGFSTSVPNELPLVTGGMPALFFSCSDLVAVSELKLFSQSVPPEYWNINATKTIIAFFLKPFAAASLFGITASQLKKGPFDLLCWSPQKINAVRTQLGYTSVTSEKISVLEHLLMHQLETNKKACEMVRYSTDQMMNDPTPEILAKLLAELQLNERTFQRIFKKYVGITPSQYRRICQFHLSFLQVRTKEFDSLTDVAYDNGFADQSHFIRSFKEFADTTPQSYLREGLKEKK